MINIEDKVTAIKEDLIGLFKNPALRSDIESVLAKAIYELSTVEKSFKKGFRFETHHGDSIYIQVPPGPYTELLVDVEGKRVLDIDIDDVLEEINREKQ